MLIDINKLTREGVNDITLIVTLFISYCEIIFLSINITLRNYILTVSINLDAIRTVHTVLKTQTIIQKNEVQT